MTRSTPEHRPSAPLERPTITVCPELGRWASSWDALVDQLPVPSPFLRSWWLEATAGRRPVFVLVIQDEGLLGGLALEEVRIFGLPAFRLMGSGPLCPDHLDIVARSEDARRVAEAVAAWMRRQGRRVFDFEGVVADSLLASALPGRPRREVMTVAPFLPVPADFDLYLASRRRNFRATVRKTSRLLAAEDVAHRRVRSVPPDAALDVLHHLHAGVWGRRSAFLSVFGRFAEAARIGAARGEVVFHELAVGDRVIASIAAFEVAGRVSLYQSGRLQGPRWRNAATVLLSAILQDAISRRFVEVDFLRGNEGYKWGFATGARDLYRWRAANGLLGHGAIIASVVRASVRSQLGRLVRDGSARLAAARRKRLPGTG